MHLRTVALALVCCCALPMAASASPRSSLLGPEERALRTQINAYRAERGVARLKVSRPLTKAARWMSADMARRDYVDHSDSRGRGYPSRLEAFGFHGLTMAENIGAGSGTAGEALDEWKHETLSQRNLLNRTFKLIGIARTFAPNTTFGWYWTTTFGGTTG